MLANNHLTVVTFSTAKIRVWLTNEGYNRHPAYAERIVVERKLGQVSSYQLKSVDSQGRETVVSDKKADLDMLLQRVGIELENPLSWLSQDRARHFLQDTKPRMLYDVSDCWAYQEVLHISEKKT